MIGVILCGGVGSRLWPFSRDLYPKPFLRLPDGQSFIQKTFYRGADLPEAKEILVVTGADIFFTIRNEFKETGIGLQSSYILEPFGRNTAPAIAASALTVSKKHGRDALMMVLPSDHLIADSDGFTEMVQAAMELARNDRLVTFGIKPTKPETGFGYIESRGTEVVRFVEKPNEEKAREYLESGNYLWNSGMFCFKAGVMLDELVEHAPDILQAVEKCLEASPTREGNCIDLDRDAFAEVPSNSIDFAVFEKSKRVSVVHCDIGWNDVGSWNELCALDDEDSDGNRIASMENFVAVDARNCNIANQEKLVAVLGVENLLVVDTPDAILVADNSRAQDVRHIYNTLKSRRHEAHRQHRTVHRPWGSYTVLEQGPRFKIKRLLISPGMSISLQLHHHRSEHWVVVSGMAKVVKGDEEFFVNTNESVYIKAGNSHRVSNPGRIELVIIEVQSGDYLGEDDIERFDDMFGRE